ncbi:hypothetical protein SAMN02745866_04348 [Alteromonadaceae bacterium Bs31]|nr:hypothetical protein SAMN02745866_04348 [Alteromonadaceae bacterium Bs31]
MESNSPNQTIKQTSIPVLDFALSATLAQNNLSAIFAGELGKVAMKYEP